MRIPLLAVAVLLATGTGFAQRREGVYKSGTGTPGSWSINEHQTLIWNGQPYLPVGIRIDGTVDAVKAAKAAGVSDVIVDLPASGAGWDEAIGAINASNMRYLIRINSLAPMAKGFAIEPQGYRVSGITKEQKVSIDMPGATSAFVVLADKADGQIITTDRVPVTNGLFIYDAKPGAEIDHVLLVYPEMTSLEQPDFWEGLDSERDALLGSLKRHAPGPGLRGIVNPMGHTMSLPGRQPTFVPTSAYFRMEFRNYLEEKYKSVETLMRTWSLTSSELSLLDDQKKMTATFDQFARLIPLWTQSRGVGAMFDPTTNKVYACDNRRSRVWEDVAAVINQAGSRRFSRLTPAIRSVADVPVIQEWQGWSEPYESSSPSVDGIGMRAAGTTQSALMDTGSRATSSILRWSSHGWLVATDLDLGTGSDAPSQLSSVLDDLGSLGAKGVFVRADTPSLVKSVAAESAKRGADASLAASSPLPVFFPENAYNPAMPQRLPGGHWWLPCPSDGDRLDLGSQFYGYRLKLQTGVVALWARKPGRYMLRMMNAKSARFQTLDGSDPEPKVKKNGVEVMLTEVPMLITGIDEVPVPEYAYTETVARFNLMFNAGQRRFKDLTEEQMAFRDSMNSFDRNPGGSFDQLRKQYWNLARRIGAFTWLEGEQSIDTNFSEVIQNAGCARGAALSLRTLIPPPTGGYYATFPLQVKTRDDQDIWLAARIPAERRKDVNVVVGGQVMPVTGDPISLYGSGFGWYKVGTTRLAGNLTRLRVQVNTSGNAEIAIDSILVTPDPFTPNAVTLPDPLNFRSVEPKQPSKGKRQRGSGAP
ncbi:MAG: hypothetical protein P4L46_03690 [Fimbriimonas sp.]|nr:hypothetical protein [Fimbriimonas sp.]